VSDVLRPLDEPVRSRRAAGAGRPTRPNGPWFSASWLAAPTAAVLLLAWSLACLVPARGLGVLATPLVTLATTTPFVCIAAVPLLTSTVRRRRWVCTGLAAVAAAFPWFFVLGYASPTDRVAPAGAQTLNLLVVNAHQGRAQAKDIVAAAVARSADVVVVTELSNNLAHELTVEGLDGLVTPAYVLLPGVDAQGAPLPADAGIGVWSKYPMDSVQSVPGTQWPAVIGRVMAPDAPFVLVAGHVRTPLPSGGAQWASDLSALRAVSSAARQQLPTTPQVMLGNLNATPWHADFRRFGGVGLVDATDVLGQGLRATWPAWSPLPLLPLDHALVSRQVVVTDVDTVVVGGTDHRALALSVKLPRAS
jgi:endonuclease/exonuclease/phosphatase (EEP) superfamily protein YafD